MNDTCSPYPLKAKGGEIYAHLFENKAQGVARGLFWSVTLDLEPIVVPERSFDCCMVCEWIPWALRDWRQLDRKSFDIVYGQDGIEASFYLGEHNSAQRARLGISRHVPGFFHAAMTMIVESRSLPPFRNQGVSTLEAEGDIPFTGLLVVPDNLSASITNEGDVVALASEHVDISCYEKPDLYAHGYIFRPRLVLGSELLQ